MTDHRSTPARSDPSPRTLWTLSVLAALLMSFSVAMWILGNDTLTAGAGVAGITLIGDLGRRLLTGTTPDRGRDPGDTGPDGRAA